MEMIVWMKILKVFNKFMTNHSSSAYQVVVIGIPKGLKIEDLLKGQYHNFELVDLEGIEEIEEGYNIELVSKTDIYDIYKSYDSSADDHGFVEDGIDYGYEDIMDYWANWHNEAQKSVDQLKKQGIKILYSKQDYNE